MWWAESCVEKNKAQQREREREMITRERGGENNDRMIRIAMTWMTWITTVDHGEYRDRNSSMVSVLHSSSPHEASSNARESEMGREEGGGRKGVCVCVVYDNEQI